MKKYQPWIGLIARLILGGTLIAAGYLKFDELDKSQMAVRAYELLPVSLANFLGITLIAFMIGISQAWARGLSIDCGCFGGGGQVAPGEADYLTPLLRDTGLALLALYLVKFPRSRFSLDKHEEETIA